MSTVREYKGKSLLAFPDDYVVLDLETTGLCPDWDNIIEIAALKVHHNEIVDEYQTLINPQEEIDPFITKLTGITNEMVADKPLIDKVLPDFLEFTADGIILGHNVHFDINFIYDNCLACLEKPFCNDLLDTMRLSRRLFPDWPHHRLCDLVDYFDLDVCAHRALADCYATFKVFQLLRAYKTENNITFTPASCHTIYNKIRAKDIVSSISDFDESHPLYKKQCVFTGSLEKMPRKDAMQTVVNFGGICQDTITKTTNILILGNNDYSSHIKDGKSSKHKKAEKYMLEGLDLIIISENIFYEMIEEK